MAERNQGSRAEGIRSYPFSLSDDAWGEGLIGGQQQEALLKLNTLFHEEMVLPCTEIMSNDVLYRLAMKDTDGRGISVLYKNSILRPLIHGRRTLNEVAESMKEARSGHRLGTKPNLLSARRRKTPRTDGYKLLLKHGNYLDQFVKPIAVENDVFGDYRGNMERAAKIVLQQGLKNPLSQRDQIDSGDSDIAGLLRWLEKMESVTGSAVIEAAYEGQFGTKGLDIGMLSFVARIRAFSEQADSIERSREIPSRMVPHWQVFEEPLAEENESIDKERIFPVRVRLRPLLSMPFDELVGIREHPAMKKVRAGLQLHLKGEGSESSIEEMCNQLNEALGSIEIKGRKLGDALSNQDPYMKIRARLVGDVPASVEFAVESAGEAGGTQIPLLSTALKAVRFIASGVSRGAVKRWREADAYTFSYYPISGRLKEIK